MIVSERLISQGRRSDTPTSIRRPLRQNSTSLRLKVKHWHDPAWELTVSFQEIFGNQLLVFQEHFLPLVLCFNHLHFAGKKKKLTCFPDCVEFLLQLDLLMLAPSKLHDLGRSVHEEISLHHAGFAVPEMFLSCTFFMHFPQILTPNNIPVLNLCYIVSFFHISPFCS